MRTCKNKSILSQHCRTFVALAFLTLSGYAVWAGLAVPSYFSVNAYAAVTGASQHIVAVVRSDYTGETLWGEVDIEGLPRPQPPDAVLSAAAIDAMVQKAVELAVIDDGSLSAYFNPDDWICVALDAGFLSYPEFGAGIDESNWFPGSIADPRLVRSFLDLLASEKCGNRITLVARVPPSFWKSTWNGYYEGLSYEMILKELGAKHPEIVFDAIGSDSFFSETAEFAAGSGSLAAHYSIPQAVAACDKFAGVAALRMHQHFRVSMNIMNYLQFLAGNAPESGGEDSKNEIIAAAAVDLFALKAPSFVLIDGISGGAASGGDGEKSFRGNMALAGKDPVAVDAVGAMLLGMNPWDVDHFHQAAAQGAGTFDPDSMDIRGTPLKDAAASVASAMPGPMEPRSGRGVRRWLVNGIHEGAGLDDMPLDDDPFLYPEPEDEEGGKTWIEHISPGDYVDLSACMPGGPRRGLSYVYMRFLSSVQEEACLWFSGNGNFALFFNDEEIFRDESLRAEGSVPEKISVPVKRGYNDVLLKAERTGEEYGFTLHVASSEDDGSTKRGIKILEP